LQAATIVQNLKAAGIGARRAATRRPKTLDH
jgi:hypothetical protein